MKPIDFSVEAVKLHKSSTLLAAAQSNYMSGLQPTDLR